MPIPILGYAGDLKSLHGEEARPSRRYRKSAREEGGMWKGVAEKEVRHYDIENPNPAKAGDSTPGRT